MIKAVTNSYQISKIEISGYKSIKNCQLELGSLNILIGSNGAGKSNFISFFKLLSEIRSESLQLHIGRSGGPDALLHYGRKESDRIKAKVYFGLEPNNHEYLFELEPTQDNRLMFSKESLGFYKEKEVSIGQGHFESKIRQSFFQSGSNEVVDFSGISPAKSWQIYHFHDTSDTAKVKQVQNINDNRYLRHDASNLAAFLYLLRSNYPNYYKKIVKTIQLAAPYFGDFVLRPSVSNSDKIELEWTEKNHDEPFKTHVFSDGTLRFICLATVLLQPDELMPNTILIDEPELGLHPHAIAILASLLQTASERNQIIVSTQSVELINQFEVENLIVVDRKEGESKFSWLDKKELSLWLEEYSLGEIWQKNLLGGTP